MKKIISAILIIVFLMTYIMPVVNAIDINESLLYMKHYTDYYLQFSNGNKVRTAVVVYNYNNKEYPAYCIEPTKDGVGEVDSYNVEVKSIEELQANFNNDGVWRILTNGYPYKTPQQMGLNNEDEAYFATKQAIYRYMYNEDVSYYGGGGIGERGKAVYNVIANLLNEGYNGQGSIMHASANIIQQKALDFDNKNINYYSATYSVTANTIFNNYTVMIETDKTGIIIADENNNPKSQFNANERFKILVPRDIVADGANFNVGINAYLSCETNLILYGRSYNPDLQSYVLTIDPYEDVSTYTSLLAEKIQEEGKIVINKVDNDTNTALSGVTFELYKGNRLVDTKTTGTNGRITFSNLEEGTYTVRETATKTNYILNTTEETVNIGLNETKTITVGNEYKKGNLKIYKSDKDNTNIPLENVVFELYSKENNKKIGTYTTNANGEIFIEDLRIGDYRIHEVSVDKWYNMSEDVEISIEYKETTDVHITNELKKGKVKVIKVDVDNNTLLIKGVKFNVMNAEGEILETIVTDENGEAETKNHPIRDHIFLKEIETDKNYVLNEEITEIELEENKTITKVITNESKKGKIQVLKLDLDNQEIGVEGVTFNIYNEKTGELVESIVTDKNGIATSKDLTVLYTYCILEVDTNEKYVLNNAKVENIQTVYKKTIQKQLTNELKKGLVRIIKVDKDNNEVLLEGVTFEILDEEDKIVDTIITDERGEAISKKLPCIDRVYRVREKETRIEYVLSEEVKTITLKQDQIKNIKFENEKIKGKIQIIKVDSKDNEKVLAGAVFGIFDEEKNLVEEITTDIKGVALSSLLPYGKYYIKELETGSNYYLLNNEVFELSIQNNLETLEITIENEPTDIEVNIEKEGDAETQPGKAVNYSFSNIANLSNIYLEDFKWFEYVPTDYIRVKTMTTGTYNQNIDYNVYYKTNLQEDYILFKENLNSKENYDLDFTEEILEENEYITEILFDFGKVNIGFKEKISPTLQCIVLETLEDGEVFTNKTKVIGVYGKLSEEKESDITTIVHIPKKPEVTLPKTR